VDDGMLLGGLVLLGAALSAVKGCTLDIGACNAEGDADGGLVDDGTSLGALLLLGAKDCDGNANGGTVDDGASL